MSTFYVDLPVEGDSPADLDATYLRLDSTNAPAALFLNTVEITSGDNIVLGDGADILGPGYGQGSYIGSQDGTGTDGFGFSGVFTQELTVVDTITAAILTNATIQSAGSVQTTILAEPWDQTTPLTGGSHTASTSQLLITPAGTIANFTLTMPVSPLDGQQLLFLTTQTISTLSMTGATIVGAITSLAANASARYVYSNALTTWFHV